jgi:cell volume regulation protein A
MEIANHLILVGGLLFIVSILASMLSPRVGVPLLLVFLIVGMFAGEDGPGGIDFHDFKLANLAGTLALAVVLFDGGMRTRMTTFRVGLRPAVTLATVGVIVTTGVVGAFSAWVLDLPLVEGLLIGAIVGSTDAAAVFSLLHNNAVHLNERVTSALEIESGTNDPMAVFLTLGLLQYLQAPEDYAWYQSLVFLFQQMATGILFGIYGGRALVWALNRLKLSDSMVPLLALFSGLFIFGITASLHGSGFLAVYLAGVVLGNNRVRAFGGIRRFHDGVAWTSQDRKSVV